MFRHFFPLILMTVITVKFFFPFNFLSVYLNNNHKAHVNMHTDAYGKAHTCISFQSCHCHPYASPSPLLVQIKHSKGSSQPPCWSPVSTTALNLVLWLN